MTNQPKELATQRQARLRDVLRTQPAARVEELAERLGASPATIRRDLAVLEREGRLRRVHGGAVSAESRLDEPLFDDKTSLASDEKKRIAAAAYARIAPEDTVYLDGGSTVLELAYRLAHRTDITVVTHSLRAAMALADGGPRVIVIGGELRRRSQTMVGTLTRFLLNELNFDKAFMGTIGLTSREGPTTTDPNEASTKELIMQRSREVYLLADSSKIGKVSFARAGRLSQIHYLISDRRLPAQQSRLLRKAGLRVLRT